MKKFWKEFFLRGLLAASGGPVVLAIIYGILGASGQVTQLNPSQVCTAMLTVTLLAFTVAGMTAIYQLEQLPLPMMILIHGGALYAAYILVYLINGWLANQLTAILVFSGIFLVVYALIWVIIYCTTKLKTKKINNLLKNQ